VHIIAFVQQLQLLNQTPPLANTLGTLVTLQTKGNANERHNKYNNSEKRALRESTKNISYLYAHNPDSHDLCCLRNDTI